MRTKTPLLPIYLLTFVNTIGFSILIPVLPYIVDTYGGGAITYGLLISSYSAFQFIGAPILGSLSDKYGRRPLLMISQAGTLASWFIFALAYFVPSTNLFGIALPLIVIAISRIIDGITGGNMSVATAYISDKTEPHQRSKVFGTMGAIFGSGLLIGPAMGGFSSGTGVGYLGTVIVAAIISVITLLLIYFYLPESLDKEHSDEHIDLHLGRQINIFAKIARFSHNPFVLKIISIRFLLGIIMAGYFSILILYIKDKFQLNEQQSGLVFLVIGSYIIINQGFIIKKLIDKFSDYKVLYLGQTLLFIGLIILFFVPSLVWFFIITFIINLGITSSMPTSMGILSNHVDRKQQGRLTGLTESIMSFSNAIMPVIAGILYQQFSQFTFIIFSLLLLLGHSVIFLTFQRK